MTVDNRHGFRCQVVVVADKRWRKSRGPLRIEIGLGGILISLVLGFGYFKPLIEKVNVLVEERGPEDPGVRALTRQSNMVATVELAVFLVVVWAMVTKP